MSQVSWHPQVRHQLPEVTIVESLNQCLSRDAWITRLAAYQYEVKTLENFAGMTANR